MRCIFCKENSDDSKSVEHIIPESLGNKSHVLEKGIVCDKCNNYFANKIENVVLNIDYFRNLRHRNFFFSKKDRLPMEPGYIVRPIGEKIDILAGGHKSLLEIQVPEKKVLKYIIEEKINVFSFPQITFPPLKNIYLSRLIGKIALEVFAERIKSEPGWNNYIVDNEDLDSLRRYVRYGEGSYWDYNCRRVYGENDTINISKKENIVNQIIHEFGFLYIEEKYLFFICVIMGIEYVINLAEPNLIKYIEWIKMNGDKSPLFNYI